MNIARQKQLLMYFYLLVISWAPIPLGSNRPWAWAILQLCIFVLTLATFITCYSDVKQKVHQFRVAITIWIAFIAFCLFQLAPIPDTFLNLLGPDMKSSPIELLDRPEHITQDIGQSVLSLVKTISYFCVFLLTIILIDTQRRVYQLLVALLMAATFQATYGSIELLSGIDYSLVFSIPVANVARGTYVYQNHFANFLVIAGSAGIGLMVYSIQATHMSDRDSNLNWLLRSTLAAKTVFRLSIAIVVIALILSKSRMGNVAFFSSMLFAFGLSIYYFTDSERKLRKLFITMLFIDLILISFWFGIEDVGQRLVDTTILDEGRLQVINDALPLFFDHLIVGTGGGSFYSVFPQYTHSSSYFFYDHLHNDYLQFLIEYGIFGFSLLASLVLYSIYQAVKALRTRKNRLVRSAALTCCMGIVGMLVHVSVDFPLQAPANAAYFCIFLALSLVCGKARLRG